MPRHRRIALLALLAGAYLASPALAADEVNVTNGITATGSGLAVHGYDVVAYFEQGRPTPGIEPFSTSYGGATWRFASRAHLETFREHPARYLPAYGGFCAYGVAVGKKFDGDPRLWKIVDGRLFLNLDADIQEKWARDIPGHVAKADDNWQQIAHAAVGDL